MATRRKTNHKKPELGNLEDENGIAALAAGYLRHMEERNYSKLTILQKEFHLRGFIRWCDERAIARPDEITLPIMERYQRFLFQYRQSDGNGLSFKTQRAHLVTVQIFFKWLCRSNFLPWNPAADLELPKVEKRLPRGILSQSEVEQVLNLADVSCVFGLRDRAVMEVLYSCGLRRMELVGLSVYDVDFEKGTLFVNQGKGKKDRVVPVGERALKWIQKYLEQSRPEFLIHPDERGLFLNNIGQPLTPGGLGNLVKRYIREAGIERPGACHLFRHTMATLMLENGADIRYIQQMLGHKKLETTQIYTNVSIRKLKEVHTTTHPAKPKKTISTDRPEPDTTTDSNDSATDFFPISSGNIEA